MIARNQGSTKIASHATPARGLSDSTQPAVRSTTISATAASPTTIAISGPFSSTPAASAVQNTAAVVQALEASSLWRSCHRYARAIAPMAATTVMSNMASVLAIRRSTPRRTQLAIISPASTAARRDKGRNPIEPDGGERVGKAERARRLHHARLQPINADRLLVAHFILETDVDVLAALHHLLGRLGKARLVTVDRRNAEEPGQEAQQRDHEQHRHRPRVRTDGEVDNRLEAARGSP